ncbi:MAG TPA: FAD-dependent oxidoreductase [Myxococcaceae bacterium]|nr:FAD-dependent oxidoreductase [Myxococcaceae bacterium]
MAETTLPVERREQIFPVLTEAQLQRIAHFGSRRAVRDGEILFRQGDEGIHFFVILRGELDIVQPHGEGETLIVRHQAGNFTGETAMLAGRRALATGRFRGDGEVVDIPPSGLRNLVVTDAELSELLMRAFILRRVALINNHFGDAVVVGSRHCARTQGIREFLERNAHPYVYLDVEQDEGARVLVERFHIGPQDIPVLICRGTKILRAPNNAEVAECLGFNAGIACSAVRDVLVVGAGPAGLSAAVYAASEGLDVLVLETNAPGGQAGSSSKIENYLGFPTGISGAALAGRAFTQAQKFGAEVAIASTAVRLDSSSSPYVIELEGGHRIRARSVVIATGAEYRKLDLENRSRFENAGVYYGAMVLDRKVLESEEVVVVGGGNSAGQAAVYLSGVARHVHMLVRSGGLADSMSRYLIRRIEESPRITLRTRTEIVALSGNAELEGVRWRNGATGETEDRPVRNVFCMMGASPCTSWLEGCVALDDKGFVKTGQDLTPEDLASSSWPLSRPPLLLETSRPGIFAVGDVRSGNIKRVASAVGEGSISIQLVHRVLAS